eukprot:TRINITY_DN1343_c0_g1_i4.p1 TRINITY_DN1343_c0_g1~~TRINITY_DN1343_c0_g1_i4.p1  ORF type:complete len:123 (-),score=15.35 TRINITY_DN1343_c0_g1_i4:322-660(-)
MPTPELLFSVESLVNLSYIPHPFHVRPLNSDDYDKGFCQVLGQLSVVGDITKEEFQRRFRELQSVKDTYYIIVVENLTTKEIVGSGSLIIERKFLHHCGNVRILKLKVEDFV